MDEEIELAVGHGHRLAMHAAPSAPGTGGRSRSGGGGRLGWCSKRKRKIDRDAMEPRRGCMASGPTLGQLEGFAKASVSSGSTRVSSASNRRRMSGASCRVPPTAASSSSANNAAIVDAPRLALLPCKR